MSRFSQAIPPRWKAGCLALMMSWMVCASILKKVTSGIFWVMQEIDSLSPITSATFGVLALLLLGPLVVTAVIKLFTSWRESLEHAIGWWLLGFRISLIGLLVLMPFELIYSIPERLHKAGLVEPGTLSGALSLLPWAVLFIFSPIWTWALLRRLPQTFLGRGLFDSSDLESIEQNPDL